jgi:PPM family protein phosphatase
MTLALRYAVRSDRGLVRSNNEDSVYAGPRLLALADGMGGYVGGEVASKIVIDVLTHLDEDRRTDDLIAALRDATVTANDEIRVAVEQDRQLEGMGTTLTALLFHGNRIGLAHVGDSRAYLLRSGQLIQITHDHTFVQSLVDEGRITEEEASSHPQKSLILRAMTGTEVEPDLSIREARVGDRYLVCSDGLSDVVSPDTILEALQHGDPQDSADRLVDLALRAGGPDNVTCIVADVIDVPYADDAPVLDGAAGGNRGQRDPDPTSPAARAAAMRPRPEPEDTVEEVPVRPRRRRRRFAFGIALIVLLLGGGAFALWTWTQAQYFVAADGDQVAIYRGVNTAIGPVHLYSLVSTAEMQLDDLVPVAQQGVRDGITAKDRADAERIVANLAGQQKPLCPVPTPTTPAPTPTTRPPAGRTTPPAAPTPTPAPTATGSATSTPGGDEGCRR